MLEGDKIFLRKWEDKDKEEVFLYAKDEDVALPCGFLPHQSAKDSLFVIQNILNGKECYAIINKETNLPIGSIELMLNSELIENDNQCELGLWLGKPFWGKGYILDAANVIIKHAFNDLNMDEIFAGYFEGNIKSKRLQEKLGFKFMYIKEHTYISQLNDYRNIYVNKLTKKEYIK